ncbi:unnamed protein product [Blepharisma stoltei]|uniref:Thioredoxin-like protein n=1 Tax=Blepharisma stoltei TaxID=1481888 RepID=A0AAU9JQ73_9CILI|nr:unnamed protein product [Blepharisma stoltei]
MPWLTVSHGDLPLKRFLSEKYKILTSPALVLIDKDGNALNTNCRWELEQKGVEALKGWLELVAKAQTK